MRKIALFWFAALLIALVQVVGAAELTLESLQPQQTIGAFKVEALYVNDADKAVGARFRHAPSGFILDLLRIQSVPQAYIWVNSPPASDMGEPHTCEHLLLGKGNRGRYVAALEDMSLGSSTAGTYQLHTDYSFHTNAGGDIFYQLLEAKMDALLHPDFSDEEIRREVCNMGISVSPENGSLSLEEKGTVYTEMVSTFERAGARLWYEYLITNYGKGHPCSNESGGTPEGIRTQVPGDLWAFHDAAYKLSNMGMIVSLPSEYKLQDFIDRTSDIFARVEPDSKPGNDPGKLDDLLPPPHPAPAGTAKYVEYPLQNADEPGYLMFGWPPMLKVDNNERYLLSLFLDLLASGETSNLHKRFIDSDTRVMDVGASGTFGQIGFDVGNPVIVGLSDVRRDAMEKESIDSIKSVILGEMRKIVAYGDGSDELKAFNERARNSILERTRNARKFLSSPPGFGFRHSGDEWRTYLLRLQESMDFRKDLTGKAQSGFATQLIDSGKNFWREYVNKWHLLDFDPYSFASVANPGLIEKENHEKQERLDQFTNALKARYAVATGDEALKLYRASYDSNTSVIEDEAKKVTIPDFVKNPPMTLDDQLVYRVEKLPGGNPLVVSTFETMTGATAGLAFNMDVVPDKYLLYVPALPALMTQVGVIKDGVPISYDDAAQEMKKEILWLNASYDVRYSREKVELVVSGSGSDKIESEKALDWIDLALFSPDWRRENLSRIRDVVDQRLSELRNTMQGPEEYWVNGPASAFLRQSNPMILSAGSFLTQCYSLERLRWMLRDAASQEEFEKFSRGIEMISRAVQTMDRAALAAYLDTMAAGLGQGGLLADAVGDIRQNLGDVPDATLREDMTYICNRIVADLKIPPETVLADLNSMMALIRRQSNVRAYLVSGSSAESDIIPRIDQIAGKLSKEPSAKAQRQGIANITSRLAEREQGLSSPTYVGLVNPNTRNGVIVNNSPLVKYTDTDRESLLRFLSSKLLSGGAPHGLFMKTWGAGLAYSNGVGSSELSGRISYYAERCPDLAQTLQFITNEIKNAERDTTLSDYSVAQVFGSSRAASSYEERGQAMATDLADGITPQDVRRFREEIMNLRNTPGLYDQLYSRMKDVYAPVMPGLEPNTPVAKGSVRFIIGPEFQFESLENYLKASGENAQVYRLYPRDFWIAPTIVQ